MKHLNSWVTKDFKNLIKKYISHVTIKLRGKTKSTLIHDIMTHTELINSNIYLTELHNHIKSANIKENNDINVKWRRTGLLR